MSGRDPKAPKEQQAPLPGAKGTVRSPEEVTLNAHGFAQTAPISDEVPVLPPEGDTRLRLIEGEMVAGPYQIIRFLAQGGMGEVYEAEDKDLGERVALKTIREETRDTVAEERFKREIQLSRKVTHPNVCRIFDVGYHDHSDGGRFVFLTMELLGGETLLEHIRRDGPLEIGAAARTVRHIVAALKAAHAVGVVHRDLKSSNVILSPVKDGGIRAVVTDFGLAHVVGGGGEEGRSLSGSGGIVGTPGYMAPEQVEGGALSARTDVYSLGVVMFEMLTGKLPFEGATPLSIAAKRLTTPAPSPKKLRADLPPRWERAVLACMERDPRDRPASARAVLDLLEEDGSGSASVRVPKLHRRARLVQPAIAFVLATLAVVIGLRAWHARPRAFADELRLRGVSLGSFEAGDVGQLGAYGILVRNAVRTELALGIPVIDARSTMQLDDGRSIDIGFARPRTGNAEPFKVSGRYTIRGDGADRTIEVTLRIIDPRTNEERGSVVEEGALRKLGKVLMNAGDRLRAAAGIEPATRRALQAAGRTALDEGMEAMRDGDLAKALEIVEKASVAEPDTVELRYVLARVLAGLELDVASSIAVDRAFALGPAEDPFWAQRVEALRLRTDASHSASVLESLSKKYPQNIDVALDLSRVYVQAQRGVEALALLDRLELQALAPRERLRVAIERLIIDERLDRRKSVERGYQPLVAQARELKLPGLEESIRRIACTTIIEEATPSLSDPVCGELRTLAEQMRLPSGIVTAELAWASARAPEDANAQVLDHARRALGLAIQLGGRRRLADALGTFAIAARDTGSEEYDEDLFNEALAIARDAHDQMVALATLFNLAVYAQEDGRIGDETRYLRQAVELARDSGSNEMSADSQCRLALSLIGAGDVITARRLHDEGYQLLRRGPKDTTPDDCGELTGHLLDAEGRYPEARAHYEALAAAHEKAGGVPGGRIRYYEYVAEVDYEQRDWKSLLISTNQLVTFVGKNGARSDVRTALLMRAIAQAEFGRKAEAASLPAFVREHDDAEAKLIRTKIDLWQAALDRRLGAPRGELGARIDAVIAVGVSAQDHLLELNARLERLALLVREHDPSAAREAKDIEDRAKQAGFNGIAHRASQALRGGK